MNIKDENLSELIATMVDAVTSCMSMYATTLSMLNSLSLRDSPPFQAGVGLEMLSPRGYTVIIY